MFVYKNCLISELFVLGLAGFRKHCRKTLPACKLVLALFYWSISGLQNQSYLKKVCESVFGEIVVVQSLFAGNRQLNCCFIESIFDMSLLYLHMLVQWHRSQRPMLLKLIASSFAMSNSRLVTFCYFEFRWLELQRKIVNFSLRMLYKTSSENLENSLKIHGKFAKTNTNFDELRLHYFCTVLYM